MGAGKDQRLWFVVDEFDSLGAIDGLKDALARLRKFGGEACWGFSQLLSVDDVRRGKHRQLSKTAETR